jgi:UDP-glucose 4-epimerase
MRVGVTGGAGFIGGYVCDELLDRGHEAVIFDQRRERAQRSSGTVMLGDTRDETAVTEFAARVDGIIHLASVLGTQETVQNPRPAVMTNVVSGMNVFEAATQYKIPVVNICVGNAGMSNPYSASKTCVESLGWMYVRDRGTRLNQVRVVNAYGPRQVPAAPYGPAKVRKIMPAFICRALAGDPIEIYGDGQQISDCVYVHDVAVGLVNALEAAAEGRILEKVAEIGPEDNATVQYIATLVAQETQAVTNAGPVPITHVPMRPGETPGARVVADTSTLPLVGMQANDLTTLGTGIKLTVEWYAQNWLPRWRGRKPDQTASITRRTSILVEPRATRDWVRKTDERLKPWRPLT